jgi:anti-anti-sigma factor
MTAEPTQSQSFLLERHGDVAVIIPSPEVESMSENLIQPAAQLVLGPLKEDPPVGLVVDLGQVKFVGSVFLSILLRFHLPMKKLGIDMVLAGVNDRIRYVLRQTNLDTLWAIYDTRDEALRALGGSD